MGVFHVFKIVQMVPNRAKHHKCCIDKTHSKRETPGCNEFRQSEI